MIELQFPPAALRIVEQLVRRRLADIDVGAARQVIGFAAFGSHIQAGNSPRVPSA